MATLEKIPINILISILSIVMIYMLYKTIKVKTISHRLSFLSIFIFCFGIVSTSFITTLSLQRSIMKFTVIIAVLTLLSAPIVMFFKGDSEDKERATVVFKSLIFMFLFIIVMMGIFITLFNFFNLW
ncbi:hypothetical protein [Bacillus sp. JJ1764]|uniref:hypothetical protein n=1 Tax=Bacillus sp. JJ1764 TaxID=3122964 RepID=UPI002FFDB1EB